MEELPKILADVLDDLVTRLLHDGRKEDEELPRGEIERLCSEDETMCCQITGYFAQQFHRELNR